MSGRWLDLLVTGLLATGFAAVGETVLRRRSRDVVSWNESFLVGMAVCAAALFPLTLVVARGALRAELTVMGLCLLATLWRRRGLPTPPAPPPAPRDPAASLVLAAILLVAACFSALDLRYNLAWDAFQIWASKAQLLFFQGGLGRTWYETDTYELRHITYPPLVPLFEALLALVRGRFDFDTLKPVFLPFYFSMLVATYGAVRGVLARRPALAATLLVALLPLLSTGNAAGGYADMPQAAFVAGVACAALRRDATRSALPWLIGGLTTVKAEGTILAAVAAAAVVLFWLIDRSPDSRSSPLDHWNAVAVTLAFFGVRFAFLRWAGVRDAAYDPLAAGHFAEAVRRMPHVARVCLVKMLSPRRWGLFWAAFFPAALVLALRGTSRERSLVVAITAATALLAIPFLFTTWPLDLHIDQAYGRLLSQLAPAAGAAILIGFHRAKGSANLA